MFRLSRVASVAYRSNLTASIRPRNAAFSVLASKPNTQPKPHPVFAQQQRTMSVGPSGFFRVILGRGILLLGGAAGTGAIVLEQTGALDVMKAMKDAVNGSLDAVASAGEVARGALYQFGDILKGVATPSPQTLGPQISAKEAASSSSSSSSPSTSGVTSPSSSSSSAGSSSSSSPENTEKLAKILAENEELKKKYDEIEALLAKREAEIENERIRSSSILQQRIIELEKENNALHHSLARHALSSSNESSRPKRAVDLFSDILALQSQMDKSFNSVEHLPRIVVVGDQSAGKTSVLEIIAEARIFPRGAGEMMTRSPIQVTLSESPYRKAEIKGISRVFHLDNETDLADLRKAVEQKMLASVKEGETVSHETVAIDVRGPGLRPMVLVDLPGIIQHQTKGMGKETRASIQKMCEDHIHNPNAIILCIQDGSRDPESSSVAEIVKTADPKGERTIFVLTKVDLAEQRKIQKSMLSKILSGNKFELTAKAYFPVVTGTDNPDDSIETIKKAEAEYFRRSEYFRPGTGLKKENAGTANLAKSISEAFWERVRLTVEGETKRISQSLKAKEVEWYSKFGKSARMTRDELFQSGKVRILEHLAAFNSSMTPSQYETNLMDAIWTQISSKVVDDIYMTAASSDDFTTAMNTMLDSWVNGDLPDISVSSSQSALHQEFMKALTVGVDPEKTFEKLETEVKSKCVNSQKLRSLSIAKLRHLQELKLADDVVKNENEWNQTVQFMSTKLRQQLSQIKEKHLLLVGESSWLRWKSPNQQQKANALVFQELAHYFTGKAAIELQDDELNAVHKQLQKRNPNIKFDIENIRQSAQLMSKMHFLQSSLQKISNCQSTYTSSQNPKSPCSSFRSNDLLLFWRVNNMLQASSNILRLEGMQAKKELESQVRDVLDEISRDPSLKQHVISNPQISLAEEIEVLRSVQAKMQEFRQKLKEEGFLSSSSPSSSSSSSN